MIPISSPKKIVALCLCVLLTAGAWVPLVTTEHEYTTTDTDPAWKVWTGGTRGEPILIRNVNELQNMSNDLTADYVLANDINASATKGWNDGAGFEAVGDWDNRFTGSLDGRNFTISGLYIDRPSTNSVGLFGFISSGGSVSNVGMENVDITGGRLVGGLVGENRGSVSNCYATGSVSGTSSVGGLVGFNWEGSVSNSHYNIDSVLINGANHVTLGGLFHDLYQDWFDSGMELDIADYDSTLVPSSDFYEISTINGLRDLLGFAGTTGFTFRLVSDIDLSTAPGLYIPYLAAEFDGNNHTISNLVINQSFALGVGMFGYLRSGGSVSNVGIVNVDIIGGSYVGGIIGGNGGSVSNSYATGSVSGTGKWVGGLVGTNYEGSVENCYATGSVSGDWYVGGLVGSNEGSVENCYATGSVSGDWYVGGLVGYNYQGSVENCYATGSVSGDWYVGGLVGSNEGSVENCYATGSVNGYRVVGGLVGDNRGLGASVSNCYTTGSVSGSGVVGGLVGNNEWGSVENCYATGSMSGTGWYVGGLVGSNSGSVENCYATSIVNGTDTVGGLVGYNYQGSVENCYATGNVSGTNRVGGLVGWNRGSVENCYATGSVSGTDWYVGGLVGLTWGSVSNCFWDTETSGQSTSYGGTGKTTAEMKTRSTFTSAGWDFDDVWCMMDHITYPLLMWQFDTWHVDVDAPDGGDGSVERPFNRIQDAVNAASDIDRIHVSPGVYGENVVINRSIRVIGPDTVIVEKDHPSDAPVHITAPSVYFFNIHIHNPGGIGLLIEADHFIMDHCVIAGNSHGIRVINGSLNTAIHRSTISATTGYAMDASENDGILVNALDSWWGHPSGPYHPTLNPHGRGERVSDNVMFDSWLVRPFDHRILHVSPSGNDTHGTGGGDQPYRAIQKALDEAEDWDVIMVAAGVYPEDLAMRTQGIAIFGDPGGGTVLDVGGIDDGVVIEVDDVTLRNLTVRNASESGIQIFNSSRVTISDCTFSGNSHDLNLTNSTEIRLINTTFETVHFSDPNSSLSVLWHMDLKVTDQRSGFIPDARVRITNRFGTVVFDDYTDDKGRISQMLLPGSEQNLTSTVRYDPYTIRVRKDGYLNYTGEMEITSYIRLTCVLEEHILPVARITGDFMRYVNMDSQISFDGSGSTGRSITFFWDFGDGNTSDSVTPSHTYTVPGAYHITLTVTDDYGNTSTTSVAVMVENVLPTAWARTSTTTAYEDEPIEFDAVLSWDTASDSLTYLWDFGDGSRSNDMVTTHSFARAGTYDVSLTVTDRYGGTDTDTLSFTIRNVAPWILSTEVSGELHPGKILTFRGYAEDTPSDMAGLRYAWDLGDGTLTEGRNVTHVYSRAVTYAVNLTVTDDNGAFDRTTQQVTITEPGIMVNVSSHLILQDGMVSFNASHELDDGNYTYLWHFGDGSSAEGRNVSHTYTRSGIFTLWLVISYGGGEEGNTTVLLGAITVGNVVPSPVIRVDTLRVNQDDPVTFDASGTTDSPSDLPILTYIWDFGDGTGGAGITVTHTFNRAGIYQVTLHASDGKVTATSRVTMEVVNVPPTANAGPDRERQATVGEPVILDGSASTDTPSDLPGLNFTWTVGNDTVYGKVFQYTFINPGAYNVTLRVRDEDGAVSEDTITFRVTMPVEPETEEKGMMTGFAWLLLVVVVVLLLVLLFVLSGKEIGPVEEVGELAEEVVVMEGGEKAIRPEIDNAMFKPPSEAAPEPITGEKEEGNGKDGEPIAGGKEEKTGKDGEPFTGEKEEGTGKEGEPDTGGKEEGTAEAGEPGTGDGEHDRTTPVPDGSGELADTVEDRNGIGAKRAGETGDHTPQDPEPPEDRSPPLSPPQDRPPSV